ncbi:FHA domain-containing protein [Parapedobacter pyrenivorans]|uniref:FHA domain-containing protein n=1 Tax=Parapedobacter pyrenivorans TaxID=1305674 RepID=UPI00333F718D
MNGTVKQYQIRYKAGIKANQTESFDFALPELRIGRDPASEIRFDPEQELTVSRQHARIVRQPDGHIIIEDNRSRNGLYVNGRRVSGNTALNPGDEVKLGNNGPTFIFDLDPRPVPVVMPTQIIDIPSPTATFDTQQVTDYVPVQQPVSKISWWYTLPVVFLLAGAMVLWMGFTKKTEVSKMVGDGELDIQIFPLQAMMPAAYKVYANPMALDGRFYFSKVVIDNKGSGELRDVKVDYAVPGYIDWTAADEINYILPGGASVVTIYPQFPQRVVEKTTQSSERMQIRITYLNSGKPEKYEKSYPFQMLSRNDYLYTNIALSEIRGQQDFEDNNDLAPVFITPQDPIVKYYTQQVQEKVLGGATAGVTQNPQEVVRFMMGVYEATRRTGMVYSGTSGAQQEIGDIVSTQQKIRLPREVITGNTGLCIEMAFLYASVFASEGLDPVIFFVPGHAYPGVHVNGQYFAIEATAVGGAGLGYIATADQALQAGMKQLNEFMQKAQQGAPGYSLIEVKQLINSGVHPMELTDDTFMRVKVDQLAQRMTVGGPLVFQQPAQQTQQQQ